MGYELHWLMHNHEEFPQHLIPNCKFCGKQMVRLGDCDFTFDDKMQELFSAQLGEEESHMLECEGYFSFATERCFCPSCIDDDKSYPLDQIRWYWGGGPDYINGVLELPSDQRKRKQLEHLQRQVEAGQQILPGFPQPDFSILEDG